jgi:hypothetical protein
MAHWSGEAPMPTAPALWAYAIRPYAMIAMIIMV